ncbi:MAG: hypothetical protein RIR69_1276 [Actinomycetota bacterium]
MSTVASVVNDKVEQVRRALADALRDRVVGDNADQKREDIMLAPGERWFSDDRPIHIVHTDASMFIGGMRALLLQSLHPLAMAGVAQHSDYRSDPWGRLQRTADFLAATSFGPADLAEKTIARIRAVHTKVVGTTTDGRPYSASDPHLLRWVHVAELDSFIAAHRAYGAQKLDEKTYDAYVEDMAVIARKLGVPAPPTSVQGLRDQLIMYRYELASTPESRDAAKYLLLTPPLSLPARVPYSLIAAAAIAILPAWARNDLRLPYLPVTEKAVVRPIGHAITSTIRWATAIDPLSSVDADQQ